MRVFRVIFEFPCVLKRKRLPPKFICQLRFVFLYYAEINIKRKCKKYEDINQVTIVLMGKC